MIPDKQALQKKHDELMSGLPHLDFGNDVAVLDWLSAFTESGGDMRVEKQLKKVLVMFAVNGFIPNCNLGKDFDENDRDNHARYIIGQALDGLSSEVGAPPEMIPHLIERWKRKFVPSVS